MSTPNHPIPISVSDVLVLIANQARVVANVSEAIMYDRPLVSPQDIIVHTNRLSDLVAHFVKMAPEQPDNSSKAA